MSLIGLALFILGAFGGSIITIGAYAIIKAKRDFENIGS